MVDLTAVAADPLAFRQALLIETPKGLEPLADCCDPRQAADFAAVDAALRTVAGLPAEREPLWRHWWERPRGGSKTQDAATVATWLLSFARRTVQLVGVASDMDQARQLSDAIGRLVRANPWLKPVCEPQRYGAVNPRTESRLTIESSDAPSSFGWLVDAIVCDEVSMWSSDAIWQSALSAAGKKPCVLLCAMNSGFLGSWPHALREKIKDDSGWRFSHWDSPAAWITEATLAEQERFLRPGEYRRLWCNEWVPSLSDALPGDMIEKAIVHDGPMWAPELPEWDLAALGVDLGHSHDHSAICVLSGSSKAQKVRVARVVDFPVHTPFEQVGQTILSLAAQFGVRRVVMDEWQSIFLAETLRAHGLNVVTIAATAQSNARQCTTLLSALRDGTLELYPDDDLLQDLRTAQLEEKVSGPRLIFASDDRGHGDRLSAMLHALVSLAETLPFCALEEPDEPTMMHILTDAGFVPVPMGSVSSVQDVDQLRDRVNAACESFGAGSIQREGIPSKGNFFG